MTDHDDPMPGYGRRETDEVSDESGFAVGADPEAVRPELWADDEGTLDFQTRKLLALVMKGPGISGKDRPKVWDELLAKRRIIRSRLNDMFLDLVIDETYRIAFVKQVRTESPVPLLLERESLTLIQTAVFILLCQHFKTADAKQNRAIIDFDQILTGVRAMRHLSTDISGFEDRLRSAVKKAIRFGILTNLRAEDHYEISPLIRHVVSSDFLDKSESFTGLVARRGKTAETPTTDAREKDADEDDVDEDVDDNLMVDFQEN